MDWVIKNLFSILNLITLILLSLCGRAWVNRKKANLEKEIEELKSSHSKEQFIHKLQFEKEFKTYEYLWMKITHFKKALEAIFREPDKPKDKKQIDDFLQNFEEVKETIGNSAPFISKEIYSSAQDILNLAIDRSLYFAKTKTIAKERILEIREKASKIHDNIEKAIRDRIKNLEESKLIE